MESPTSATSEPAPPTLQQVLADLEWVCSFYENRNQGRELRRDWEGTAYEMVSMVRKALAALKAIPENQEVRELRARLRAQEVLSGALALRIDAISIIVLPRKPGPTPS